MKQKSTVKNDEPKLKKRRKVAVESEEIKASVETERKELAKTKTKRHTKAMNKNKTREALKTSI